MPIIRNPLIKTHDLVAVYPEVVIVGLRFELIGIVLLAGTGDGKKRAEMRELQNLHLFVSFMIIMLISLRKVIW